MSSNIKEEKKKKKRKKKKKKRKKKEKEEKLQHFALKPEHGPRGIWRKSLKLGALNQLVGSHRLSARYMGGWVDFRKLYVLEFRNHSESGVKPEELVVERS